MQPGDEVEVRTRFAGAWAGGYEVVERVDHDHDHDKRPAYRVRARGDGRVLPVEFDGQDVRLSRP